MTILQYKNLGLGIGLDVGLGIRSALMGLAIATAFATAAPAQQMADLPQPFWEKIEDAQDTCASFENGELTLQWDAAKRVDLDGDQEMDWVLDESGFSCSTVATAFCGTGGCASHFFVDGIVKSVLNQGWHLVTVGRDRVLLVDVHGSLCGGSNATPCVVAGVWDFNAELWRSAVMDVE